MAQDEPASLPFLAVSAAVGAVVLLVVLLYNLFIGKQDLQVDSTQKGELLSIDNRVILHKLGPYYYGFVFHS